MIDRILVISPHTDDGELGAGGTIARFLDEHKEIYYAVFSSCEDSIPAGFPKDILKNECNNAIKELGISPRNATFYNYRVRTFSLFRQDILDDMINIGRDIKPDLVLLPSSNDIHQDHQVINSEGLRAFKKISSIWGYEHPWNNMSFSTDIFVKLEERHIHKKIGALKKYKSQNFRKYFEESYIKSLAFTRGTQVDYTFAESFELLRMLV